MAKQETTKSDTGTLFIPIQDMKMLVLRNLRQRIDSLGMEDKIFNVVVPTEKGKLKSRQGSAWKWKKKSTRIYSR